MSSLDKRFTPAIVEAAQTAGNLYRVPPSITLAQWALESAFGTHMPAGSNNPFGIKAKVGAPSVEAMTTEFIAGRYVRVEQPFARYPTLDDAFGAHAKLIATSPYYLKAMRHTDDPDAFAKALTGVYATDPRYGAKLIALMIASNLYQFDKPSAGATIA